MLVKFKSEGAGDVLMFGEVAEALMEIIGKQPGERGVITVEQLPEALARLKAAMARDRAAPRPLGRQDEGEEEAAPPRERFVSLSQRAQPLVELLEHALREEAPVLWGV